jgi:hypothetical protein
MPKNRMIPLKLGAGLFVVCVLLIVPINLYAATCPVSDNFNDDSIDAMWTSANLGSASSASTGELGLALRVTVTGDDVTNDSSEDVRFVYQSVDSSADFIITLTVIGITGTNKAFTGLMVRDELSDGSYAGFMAAGGNEDDFAFMYRETTGANFTPSEHGDWAQTFPKYIRLVKSGTSIAGYWSYNNSTWTQQGTTRTAISLTGTMYVGIAASSRYNGSATSMVDDFVVAGCGATSPITAAKSAQPMSRTHSTSGTRFLRD